MFCSLKPVWHRGLFRAAMFWICITPLNVFGDWLSDINKVYNNVLGRPADPGAYDYWRQHPTSLKEVVRNVTHSQEFKCKYIETTSDACPQAPPTRTLHDALALVYPHVLGRDFDNPAWQTASDWVQNQGWDFLINKLVDSAEFNQQIAQRWGLSSLTTVEAPQTAPRQPPPNPPILGRAESKLICPGQPLPSGWVITGYQGCATGGTGQIALNTTGLKKGWRQQICATSPIPDGWKEVSQVFVAGCVLPGSAPSGNNNARTIEKQ
jgi:hypothetical protein